eukprot:SAG31_NODE_14160_length_824_cov_1.059310_1_plen_111_part_10
MVGHAGRTPWEPKLLDEDGEISEPPAGTKQMATMKLKEGHKPKPRYRTHGQLAKQRAKDMCPHHSFDVDGDGVVSAQDFFLASKFDVNGDKVLDADEVIELRKQMVKSVVD